MRRERVDPKGQAVKVALLKNELRSGPLRLYRNWKNRKAHPDAIALAITDDSCVGVIVGATATIPAVCNLETLILLHDRHHIRSGRHLQFQRSDVIQQGIGASF